MNSTTAKYLSPWRVLWFGTLLMLFVEVVAIFTGAMIGGFATFFILLFGGFILGGVCQRFIGGWSGIAVTCSVLVMMMISSGNVARPIWLAITGHGQNSTVVELPDSEVLYGLTGYHSVDGYRATRTGGRGHPARTAYMVAPVVDQVWTTDDEVEVWAVCIDTWDTDTDFSNIDACTKEWPKNYGGGYEVEPGEVSTIKEAVLDAELGYKLSSSSTVKYINWSADPEGDVAAMVGVSIALLIFTHLAYVIGVLVKWKKIKATELKKL